MKNRTVYRLNKGCKDVELLEGIVFVYILAKNQVAIETEIEVHSKINKSTDDYNEKCAPVHRDLLNEFCLKDVTGNSRMDPSTRNFVFDATGRTEYEKAIAKFEKKPEIKKLVEERKKQDKAFEELLSKDTTLKLDLIPYDELPENINAGQTFGIFEMIEPPKK